MTDFEKSKEESSSKEKFYSLLIGKKISDREYEHVLKVWNLLQTKKMKKYHYVSQNLMFYYYRTFEKFRNNS